MAADGSDVAGGKWSAELAVARKAALAAGEIISRAFHAKDKGVKEKGKITDLVTETDQACENLVRNTIAGSFPDHKFIGEEEVAESGVMPKLTDEPTWMCDPLDGTTNFVHGFPFVCTCIALVVNKEVVVGVVHNPVLGETFTAAKDCGAFLNDHPTHCSTEERMEKALVATEIGVHRDFETMMAIMERIMKLTSNTRSVRCTGSCAMNMCGVAMGRLDAFFEIGFGGCWDVAAASVVVKEAGGRVLDPAGGPFDVMSRRVLCSNAHIGTDLAEVIGGCFVGPNEPEIPDTE